MRTFFETLVFTLVIGGQFLAAIYVVSRRSLLHPDRVHSTDWSTEEPATTGLKQRSA